MKRLFVALSLLLLACSTSERVEFRPAALNAPAFPLRLHGHYLEDQNGQPFRVQSESAWLASINATAADLDAYFADRTARGFNSVIIMAIVPPYFGGPNNRAGDAPFLTADDFATPNPTYWTFIDTIIDKAAAKGVLVQLAYAYLGYEGGEQGWWSVINQPQNTQTVMYNYGVWLAQRYSSRPNVLWYACGDFTPPIGSEGSRRVHKIVEGIKSVMPGALVGAEMSSPNSIPSEVPDFTDVINVNTFYGYGPSSNGQSYETAEQSWRDGLPAWVGEPGYEDTSFGDGSRSGQRRTQWWTTLGGAIAGSNFGTEGIWNFSATYSSRFATPATQDVVHSYELYATLPWWQLVPSGTEAGFAGIDLISSGAGSGTSQIVASASSMGDWLLVYTPPTGAGARTFDVNMTALIGTSTARWFNPITGGYTSAGAALPNTGSQSFTTPGSNGVDNDWVLALNVPTTCSGGSGGSAGAGMGGAGAGAGGAAGSAGDGGSGGSGPPAQVTFGESATLPSDDSGNGGLLVAQQATLSVTGTLQTLSFYAVTAGQLLRLGLYDATGPGGGPGAKKAESAEITTVSGWNTAAVSAVTLSAGTYWLAYAPKSNALHFRYATNGNAKWYTRTYGALPATFSTSPTSGNYHWSFYGVVQP